MKYTQAVCIIYVGNDFRKMLFIVVTEKKTPEPLSRTIRLILQIYPLTCLCVPDRVGGLSQPCLYGYR